MRAGRGIVYIYCNIITYNNYHYDSGRNNMLLLLLLLYDTNFNYLPPNSKRSCRVDAARSGQKFR